MEPKTQKHISDEQLEAYAMNCLSEAEVGPIEEHLLICETCQDHLAAVDKFVLAMQGAAKRIRREEAEATPVPDLWDRLRAWLHTPAPKWAGALAVVCLAVILGLRSTGRPGPPVDVQLEAVRGLTSGAAPSG